MATAALLRIVQPIKKLVFDFDIFDDRLLIVLGGIRQIDHGLPIDSFVRRPSIVVRRLVGQIHF